MEAEKDVHFKCFHIHEGSVTEERVKDWGGLLWESLPPAFKAGTLANSLLSYVMKTLTLSFDRFHPACLDGNAGALPGSTLDSADLT